MNYLNFKMSELLKSDTARKNHINNIPTDTAILDNLLLLITECLQPIREQVGKPITITSGYRCNRVNQLVGGARNSHHTIGTCADIRIKDFSPKEAYEFIKDNNFKYRQLILEPTWVHIEFKKDDLKQENLIYKNGRYIKI